MIKLLLYFLIAWALLKLWRKMNPPPRLRTPPAEDQRIEGGELVQDPQCGVYVPKKTALRGSGEHYFCSEACRRAFEERGTGP